MALSIEKRLENLIAEGKALAPKGGSVFNGYNGTLQAEYVAWRLQALSLISEMGSSVAPILKDLEKDKNGAYFFAEAADRILGSLRAAAKIYEQAGGDTKPAVKQKVRGKHETENRVFVVHGHDEALLERTARFLEKIEIAPVILFEQPGKGQTVIEKLEVNGDVPFAVVLFTPDDLGKAAKDPGASKPRARQNVVLELGYFVGRLGRSNVAVLYDESIELPSDYRGVEYIKIDADGAWKMKLAKEMKAAGLIVDMNKAI